MGQLAQSTFKTPEQIKQERAQATQSMFASAQSPYERMGMAIGNILGTALGVRDPALERASSAQNIYNEVLQTNPDVTSAGFYQELSRKLAAAGLSAEADYAMREGQKYSMQEREIALREKDLAERAEERSSRVTSVGVTTRGVAVFRKPSGGLFVEEAGQQVTYDPKVHGRFETAQDRVAPRSLTRTVDRFGNITFTDPQTAEIVRTVPGAFSISGAPGAAPQTGQSAGQNVTTLDQLRQRLQQK
jgi:hypothetical protein